MLAGLGLLLGLNGNAAATLIAFGSGGFHFTFLARRGRGARRPVERIVAVDLSPERLAPRGAWMDTATPSASPAASTASWTAPHGTATHNCGTL
ncbi:hypothetical protein ACWEP4_18945 [Streptomyces sp. NPDC004227]